MRLLELPPSILDSVQKDELSASHAKAILSLGTEEQQLEYARLIRVEGWSVRETERRVADQVAREEAEEEGRIGIATRAKARAKSEQISALEQALKRQLGTKIEINQTSRGRGRIVIHFANVQEFERLRAMMESGSGAVTKSA
jgi:ParB family chromosome partitioning protein